MFCFSKLMFTLVFNPTVLLLSCMLTLGLITAGVLMGDLAFMEGGSTCSMNSGRAPNWMSWVRSMWLIEF